MPDFKNDLRKKISLQRKNFNIKELHNENELIIRNIQTVLTSLAQGPNSLYEFGIYLPLKGEPDLTSIIALNRKWKFFLPKIEDNKIEFVYYKIGDKLEKNEKGILQPVLNIESIPEIIVAPGLAYSIQGYRLGFGGGFYDKYFAVKNNIAPTSPIKIGVCFDEFLLEYLPSEQHDIKFDYIITDKTILKL